jgi:hypothetical protein
MAGLFQVLWGKGGGEFEAAKALAGTDGQELLIPYEGDKEITKGICTRPWAVDWDRDGDLDLVVGNFEGTFYLFTGEGKGTFAPTPEAILAEGEPLRINGVHSDPMMVDWDGDGDLDILSGSGRGGVQWAENVAGADAIPKLNPFSELVPAAGHHDSGKILRFEDLKGPGSGTRVWAADVNGDKKLDLLVGDDTTLVSPASGMSEEEFKKAYAAWEKEYQEIGSPETDPEKENARREKLQKIINRRDEVVEEDSTGFVWVYLRK